MTSKDDLIIKYGIRAYVDELASTYIYRALADIHKDKRISEKLIEAAESEERHAETWRRILEEKGVDIDKYRPNIFKLRILILVSRLIGLGLTLRLLEKGEEEAINIYSELIEKGDLDPRTRGMIEDILEDELGHEEDFIVEESRLKEFIEHIRDAVLGMNDGLVEILSVSAGLAGVYGNPLYVALGGLIVGVGGALSMGIGSYISVKAEYEVRSSIFKRMIAAAKYAGSAIIDRLLNRLRDRGFRDDTLDRIKDDLNRNRELLGRLAAEEEYGVREETIGEPGSAGLYTGLFYLLGSIFPLLPYFLMIPISYALPASFILAGSLLAITGFIIAVSARLNIKSKIIEMVLSGIGAAVITYFIGYIASYIFGIEVE